MYKFACTMWYKSDRPFLVDYVPHITYLFAVIPPLLGIVYPIMCTKARSICTACTYIHVLPVVCVYLTVDDNFIMLYMHDFNCPYAFFLH